MKGEWKSVASGEKRSAVSLHGCVHAAPERAHEAELNKQAQGPRARVFYYCGCGR